MSANVTHSIVFFRFFQNCMRLQMWHNGQKLYTNKYELFLVIYEREYLYAFFSSFHIFPLIF